MAAAKNALLTTRSPALQGEAAWEFAYIAEYLAQARADIAALTPRGSTRNGLCSAGAQLEAIVRDTEAATNQIMSAAEAVLASEPLSREALTAEMMKIFVACSFQDITGQRVQKVVDALAHVEERVNRFAALLGLELSQPPEGAGPGLNGPHTDQAAIDRMFAR